MGLHDLKWMLFVVFLVIVRQTVAQGGNGSATDVTTKSGSTPTTAKGSGTSRIAQTTANGPNTASTIRPTISTPSEDEICASKSGSCAECLGVAGAKCLWCNTNNTCTVYPLGKVLPPSDICALDEARWGVCWLNFEALIIGVSTVGGIIILTITCCCVYCCCCRKGGKRGYEKEDARFNAQKMERKAKSDERRAERKERLDEIRRKYGLVKDEPCQRFES